jgi:hypothetical protein
MPPLALTDHQLHLIQLAPRTVSVLERDPFLRGVARHLGHEPSDDAVRAAIANQLAINKVPSFVCHGDAST